MEKKVSIIKLDLSHKNLSVLPDNIPNTLKILECAENNLTIIPNLPVSLEILDCPENKLQIIDMLENINLKILNCSSNNIFLLNIIYTQIIELYTAYNNITNYPIISRFVDILYDLQIIPIKPVILQSSHQYLKKVKVLNCQSNNLLTLPYISPCNNVLERLDISYNYIKHINILPKSLKQLNYEFNPLTEKSIKYIKKMFLHEVEELNEV